MYRRTVSWHGVIFKSNCRAGSFNKKWVWYTKQFIRHEKHFYFELFSECSSVRVLEFFLFKRQHRASRQLELEWLNVWIIPLIGDPVMAMLSRVHKMRLYSQHVQTFYFYVTVELALVFISLFPLPVIAVSTSLSHFDFYWNIIF